MNTRFHREPNAAGVFTRLRKDHAGNTLAMMAVGMIPLAGLVGGAFDMSRLYITKTRLQQACDAGALAGRKVMGGGTWNANAGAAPNAANEFFDGNFQEGDYGTEELESAFSESAGKVSGVVTANVPMTIMKVFNAEMETLTVECDAEMRLPNTDIMFVLDTTGSMAAKAKSSDTDTKIVGMKKAVKCFYEIVARLDTEAVCGDGSNPSGGTGTQVQIRFGFMPYATNVNVGKLLPTAWFADTWKYQSRQQLTTTETYFTFDTPGTTTLGSTGEESFNNPSWTTMPTVTSHTTQSACQENVPFGGAEDRVATGGEGEPYSYAEKSINGGSAKEISWKTRQPSKRWYYRFKSWSSSKKDGPKCVYEKRERTYNYVRSYVRIDNGTEQTRQVFNQWRYDQVEHDVSGLKDGTEWNDDFVLPINTNGSEKLIQWDGCIEERATVRQASYSPIPSGALDLDIDSVPNPAQPETLWGPALRGMIYLRQITDNWNQLNRARKDTTANYVGLQSGNYFCPVEAKKLQPWPEAAEFEDYVDGLTPDGNTYHDIGLIWGARFASPSGIFRSENEYTPEGGEIERHMIFMTDGDTVANSTDYGPYGFPWFDRRTTDEGSAPTSTQLVDQVNARFSAVCTAVKNKNITLWVVSFGTGAINSATETRLQNCATSGRYFKADGSTDLINTFRSIADQISQLRLTK